MYASKILAIAALGASGVLAQDTPINAPRVENNPEGKSFVATLPEEPFWTGSLDGNVKGYVSAKAGPDGVGATFNVKFENIPKEGGPFSKLLCDSRSTFFLRGHTRLTYRYSLPHPRRPRSRGRKLHFDARSPRPVRARRGPCL